MPAEHKPEPKPEPLRLRMEDLAACCADWDRPTIAFPFHCDGRDVVTDGAGLLAWYGEQFAPRDDAPDVAMIVEPTPPEIATASLSELYFWSQAPRLRGSCGCCEDSFAVVRCSHCGGEWTRSRRYARFCGGLIDKAILERFLRPVWRSGHGEPDGKIRVCRDPILAKEESGMPFHLVSERWLVVIMPLRAAAGNEERLEDPPFGEAPGA